MKLSEFLAISVCDDVDVVLFVENNKLYFNCLSDILFEYFTFEVVSIEFTYKTLMMHLIKNESDAGSNLSGYSFEVGV